MVERDEEGNPVPQNGLPAGQNASGDFRGAGTWGMHFTLHDTSSVMLPSF